MRYITGTVLASTIALWLSPAQAMSFQVVTLSINNCTTECPRVIVATGDMFLGDAHTFREKVNAFKRNEKNLKSVVLLHSNGGNMLTGLQMGRVLRSMKATVIVAQAVPGGSGYILEAGHCGTACVFALMGGVKRIVPDFSKVGVSWVSKPVPQVYLGTWVQPDLNRKFDDNTHLEAMRDYMRSMGVRSDFAAFIRKIPHESFHVMKPEEITRFGLASRQFR